MFYAVIHRPEIDLAQINEIGKKYDPSFELVGPHVTLLFPINADDVEISDLKKHIQEVTSKIKLFNACLNDLELSWDQWLFLVPTQGRDEFNHIHKKLYGGEFKKFLRTDIAFIPHLALGHFAIAGSDYSLKDPTKVPLDEEKYQRALVEVESKRFDYAYEVTSVELISINDEFTESEAIAEFSLRN